MAVVVELHFKTDDLSAAKQSLDSNRDLLQEITQDAKNMGGLHHRFLEGDGEIIVIDEWESEESFRKFFDNNPKIARVIQAAGIPGPPTSMNFFQPVPTAGTF
ncbi:hypothetical protein ACIHDR_13510 [Nocardia sp. NPDC052278]|uniref:hypothetical protein n=1 Tax=unclassified Nocardia TaxID=2637762 RepID=UPI0036BB3282